MSQTGNEWPMLVNQLSPRLNNKTTDNSARDSAPLHRREVLKSLAVLGVGSAVLQRAVAAQVEGQSRVTAEMIRQAEWISGLELTEADRQLMLDDLKDALAGYDELRAVALDNSIPPALSFDPAPLASIPKSVEHSVVRLDDDDAVAQPNSATDVAFASVSELAIWIRRRELSSVELTRNYLDRLEKHNPALECVISFMKDSALAQAAQADRELAAGHYRGPLHGIPWGAKDILAHPAAKTTWGAKPYQDQVRPEKATVIARLEKAGAVLLAKMSVGALAWGDVWYGGTTKNPWKVEQGSSGSSAGSASATAAGLVAFAIGTETWGSIVSPCSRCGATGLRPTFGRVSRFGTMALSWSMDKIGSIARTVEDCALVFGAIHGADHLDASAVDAPFHWPMRRDVRSLRVGYVQDLFEQDTASGGEDESAAARVREQRKFDLATLSVLKDAGIELIRIKLPDSLPVKPLSLILTAEASTAFDELTRSGKDDLLVRQIKNAWPNVLRQGQLIPAVEYLRANRIRTLLMREMQRVMSDIDVYVCPSFGGDNLLLTNLTGHPCVVLPNGFRSEDGTPTSITFVGRLFGETELLGLAHAYQRATGIHLKRPPATS